MLRLSRTHKQKEPSVKRALTVEGYCGWGQFLTCSPLPPLLQFGGILHVLFLLTLSEPTPECSL